MQLKIEHLSFTYDGAPEAVFADLSLSLDTAWRTGLIARNGRGKTTLLRLLSGDLQGKGKIDCPLTLCCSRTPSRMARRPHGKLPKPPQRRARTGA